MHVHDEAATIHPSTFAQSGYAYTWLVRAISSGWYANIAIISRTFNLKKDVSNKIENNSTLNLKVSFSMNKINIPQCRRAWCTSSSNTRICPGKDQSSLWYHCRICLFRRATRRQCSRWPRRPGSSKQPSSCSRTRPGSSRPGCNSVCPRTCRSRTGSPRRSRDVFSEWDTRPPMLWWSLHCLQTRNNLTR